MPTYVAQMISENRFINNKKTPHAILSNPVHLADGQSL